MRKIFRISTILSIVLAVAAGVSLFMVSQGVQQAEDDVRRLQSSVSYEEKSIHVLRAEWDYLNSPVRLEKMASEYLGMVPPDIQNVIDSGQVLPDYVAPVIPVRRPDTLMHDAVYQPAAQDDPAPVMTVSPSMSTPTTQQAPAVTGTVPRPVPPPAYLRRQSFDSLIKDLSARGGHR